MAVGPCCLRAYVLSLLSFILGVWTSFLLQGKRSNAHLHRIFFHFRSLSFTLLYSLPCCLWSCFSPNVTCFACGISSVTFLSCPFRLLPFLPSPLPSEGVTYRPTFSPFLLLLLAPPPSPRAPGRSLFRHDPLRLRQWRRWVHGHHFPCLVRLALLLLDVSPSLLLLSSAFSLLCLSPFGLVEVVFAFPLLSFVATVSVLYGWLRCWDMMW